MEFIHNACERVQTTRFTNVTTDRWHEHSWNYTKSKRYDRKAQTVTFRLRCKRTTSGHHRRYIESIQTFYEWTPIKEFWKCIGTCSVACKLCIAGWCPSPRRFVTAVWSETNCRQVQASSVLCTKEIHRCSVGIWRTAQSCPLVPWVPIAICKLQLQIALAYNITTFAHIQFSYAKQTQEEWSEQDVTGP